MAQMKHRTSRVNAHPANDNNGGLVIIATFRALASSGAFAGPDSRRVLLPGRRNPSKTPEFRLPGTSAAEEDSPMAPPEAH